MPRPSSLSFASWSACTPASIAVPLQNRSVAAGEAVQYTVLANGTAAIHYQWYEVNLSTGLASAIAGETSSQLPALGPYTATAGTNRQFYVQVWNDCGRLKSDTVTVTVSGCVAPSIRERSDDPTIAAGGTATLSVKAAGSGTLSYQWYQGPTPVGTNSPQLTTGSLWATTGFSVHVSSSCGGSVDQAFTVTVPLPGFTLTATRASASTVTVQWTPSAGAHHYQLYRRTNGAGFQWVADVNAPTVSFTDGGRTAGATYVYRVRAVSADGGNTSSFSNADLATMMTFTVVVSNAPVTSTPWNELLAGLNALRAANGWAAVTWTDIVPRGTDAPASGVVTQAAHLSALRTRIDESLHGLGVPVGPYTDVDPANGAIRAAHVQQLQQRMQ